jgi:CelD/BcsL family acetyltransferase involved in cellulose biosynthesis
MPAFTQARLFGPADVAEIANSWDALAERLGRPYCSPHWLLPWHQHVAPHLHLRCVGVFHGQELVGVAPFFEGRDRGVRTHRMSSAFGSGAPKEPLAMPGWEGEVADAVARCLASADAVPRLLAIDGLPTSRPWARALAAAWPGTGHAYREFTRPLTWIEIGDRTFDEWLDAKGAKTRKGVRRLRRRLKEQGATFRVAATADEIHAAIPDFARLHRTRWESRGGSAVVTDGTEAMLRTAAGELAGAARLWIVSIDVDGETVASEVFVRAGHVAADWLGGFDESWGRFSPGMLAMLEGIEHAAWLGVATVELGAGRQPFKHRLSDQQLDLEWALVVPPGLSSVGARSLALGRVARRRSAAAVRDVEARLRAGCD